MMHPDPAGDVASPTAPAAAPEEIPDCPRCHKPPALCVCQDIAPIDNRVSLLVLQHPQEQDRLLGTARLAALHFTDALFKVGLSWPSLSKVLGRTVDPQRWAILYLGSVKAEAIAPGREVVVVDKKGEPVGDQKAALRGIEGIVLLDGTWSQAKALWWRNGWMLKCRRVVLGPKQPSRYGKLRKEPRADGLATIEAAALLLSRLEQRPEIESALHATFERLLTRYREAQAALPRAAPPKRDWRRHKGRPRGRPPRSS